MKYTTLFFDLDDTLIDTERNSKETLSDLYEIYGWNNYFTSFDCFWSTYRNVNLSLWNMYEHDELDKQTLQTRRFIDTLKGRVALQEKEALDVNHEFSEKVILKKHLIDGAKDLLDYLSGNYELYILSNGFTEMQDRKMEQAGLDKYFKKVILSDHVGKNKPHPKIFEYALGEAHVESSDAIMIGDNIKTDITGAKNKNIDQIWFNPSKGGDQQNICPTYEVDSLAQIKDIL